MRRLVPQKIVLCGCFALLFGWACPAPALHAAGTTGPRLPSVSADLPLTDEEETIEPVPPLPPPKRNPLLERPKTGVRNRRAAFDDIDPIAIVPQNFLDGDDRSQPLPAVKNPPLPAVVKQSPLAAINNAQPELTSEFAFDTLPTDVNEFTVGPMVQTFGMGIFDNLTLFSEMTTFKTEISNGAGSSGVGEGLNWSTPITPQGTVTAQYGLRAVQSDLFSTTVRSQCFMTAALFKRFDFMPLQGGAAFDWLHDRSAFGSVTQRQLRCELSLRTFSNLEYGFLGGFDVFSDKPEFDQLAKARYADPDAVGRLEMQDYYLLFVRKQFDNGGQAEFRCGATEWGDILIGGHGEAALTDRIAINGGFNFLAPSEGRSVSGNTRESWTMSLGIVLYFRGGATFRQVNLYRPMFDVAGNQSMFSRLIGR